VSEGVHRIDKMLTEKTTHGRSRVTYIRFSVI